MSLKPEGNAIERSILRKASPTRSMSHLFAFNHLALLSENTRACTQIRARVWVRAAGMGTLCRCTQQTARNSHLELAGEHVVDEEIMLFVLFSAGGKGTPLVPKSSAHQLCLNSTCDESELH